MSDITANVSAANDDEGTQMVPLASLKGADLTKAVRAWAVDNGYPVADRGAIAPEITAAAVIANPDVPAPKVPAKRAPAAPKVPNVYDVHAADGAVITVEGGRGKCTLDRLAERAGVAVEDIVKVERAGATVDVPRRAGGPVTEPWTVLMRDGSTFDYYHGRGRLNVAKVADALGIKPTDIVEVRKGDTVHRVAMIVGWA